MNTARLLFIISLCFGFYAYVPASPSAAAESINSWAVAAQKEVAKINSQGGPHCGTVSLNMQKNTLEISYRNGEKGSRSGDLFKKVSGTHIQQGGKSVVKLAFQGSRFFACIQNNMKRYTKIFSSVEWDKPPKKRKKTNSLLLTLTDYKIKKNGIEKREHKVKGNRNGQKFVIQLTQLSKYHLTATEFVRHDKVKIAASVKDPNHRVLLVYYPLNFSSTYRGQLFDNDAFKLDLAFMKLCNAIMRESERFNYSGGFYVRLAEDKLLSIQGKPKKLIRELFREEEYYDNNPEFEWSTQSIEQDYKELVDSSSSTVDIIVIDSITSTRKVKKLFKKKKSSKIFLINLMPKKKWTGKRQKRFKKLKSNKDMQHVYVHNIPFESQKDIKKGLFDIGKIEAFFNAKKQ
jgi:hypothetical protein